jgi:hypothetical protein
MGRKQQILLSILGTLWAQPEVRARLLAALALGIRKAHRHSLGLKKNAGRGARRLQSLIRNVHRKD